MGVLCLGALRPGLVGRGSAGVRLGLGVFLLPGLPCCSPGARMLLWWLCAAVLLACCSRAAVLLACSSRAAEGLWQEWLGVGEESEGTQSAGPAAPSPSSLGRGRYLGSAKPQTLYSTRRESKAHLP